MPGTLRCGQSQNSPSLVRRGALHALVVCQLVTVIALPQRLLGQKSSVGGGRPSSPCTVRPGCANASSTALNLSTATRKHLRQHQQKSARSVQVKKLIEFLRERDPDTLLELDETCRQKATNARDLVQHVFRVYIELRQLQTKNVAEFERVLSIRALEGKCRRLAAKIRQVRSQTPHALRDSPLQDDAARLRRLQEEVFDSTQANQLIEVNRLETEVRELRRHLEERGRNKAAILETRFTDLTGLALP